MSKYTPGPWRVGPFEENEVLHEKGSICHLKPFPHDSVEWIEQRANARLIAAAPDLYKACKAINDASIWADPALAKIHNLIKAALAKAEDA